MEKGYLAVILHAHLPYVRHPEYADFLEEDWFYEAVTETYIPLINIVNSLIEDGIDFRITISLSPTLVAMFADPLLQDRCIGHIEKLIELAEKEVERTRRQNEFHPLAVMYLERFRNARYVMAEKYNRNLINAFRALQSSGKVELITCGATHGFLPLMEINKTAVKAQIKVAVGEHKRHFGQIPKGFWLPECAYKPGDDEFLKDEGIRYFILEAHGILHGSPRPKYGAFAPIFCKSGVAAFGRDMESSKAVWSAEEGYPGDYNYREFYRDIGFDLDFDYVRPYIHVDGTRISTGIKYYKITGKTNNKEPYVRKRALEKAAEHAGNFMFNREKQIEYIASIMDRKPLLLAPYDAELFGHWWFEGPEWLNFLFRKIYYDQKMIKSITPSEYLDIYKRNQVLTPSLSSWGWKGYSEVWLEGSNDWLYRYTHKAADRMVELANTYQNAEGLTLRALNQAARELLLVQASDWAFILKTGTTVPYAHKRIEDHIERFTRIYEGLKSNTLDPDWLSDIESKDNIFPDIDYRVYRS